MYAEKIRISHFGCHTDLMPKNRCLLYNAVRVYNFTHVEGSSFVCCWFHILNFKFRQHM